MWITWWKAGITMNLNNIVKFCEYNDLPDIFDGIKVPDPLSKSAVRAAIMVRCGLLTPVYGEPDVLRQMVTDWFFIKQWNFEHLVKIIQAEYSPIETYDRYEDWTDTHTGTVKNDSKSTGQRDGSAARSEQYTESGTGGSTETNSGSDITVNEVSAENSSDYQPDNKSTVTYGKEVTVDNSDNRDSSRTVSDANNERENRTGNDLRTDDLTDRHIGHLHGNIGTTQNVDMIMGEISLIGQFDPYKWIAEQFEKDFMLWIY